MFNISKQARSLLVVIAMGMVPVTIDACQSGNPPSTKNKFEAIVLVGIAVTLMATRRKPQEADSVAAAA